MKYFRLMIVAFVAMLMTFSGAAVNAALADDGGGMTVTSTATSTAHSEASADVWAEVDGAVQVLWENPNHNVRVTLTSVKKAPRLKTSCTSSNRRTQSAQIYKAAKHAKVVVVRPGSCLWNRGKHNGILMGFAWHVKTYAVLSMDSRHYYRHAYNWNGHSTLTKTCLNYIGAPVNEYPTKPVVQVRYLADIKVNIEVTADASASATATGTLNCPSGTISGTATSSGSAHASATITVAMSAKISAINAKRVELEAKVNANAKADASAAAEAKITLQCSNNPPTRQAGSISIDQVNDVLYGNSRTITVRGMVPSGQTTLICDAGIGSLPSGEHSQSVNAGSFPLSLHYTAPTEGTQDTVTCSLYGSDDGKSVTFGLRAPVPDPA
jgi:hypothetical protein